MDYLDIWRASQQRRRPDEGMACQNWSPEEVDNMTDDPLRYFALVFTEDKMGYAHDYYPEEKATVIKEYGENIIGDFATSEEATDAVCQYLRLVELCANAALDKDASP
jgi:hypothetical protein